MEIVNWNIYVAFPPCFHTQSLPCYRKICCVALWV